MPCQRRLVRDPGQRFEYQITNATNMLACSGLLGQTRQSPRTFTEQQLRHGINWTLEADTVYILTVATIPEDPDTQTEIEVRTATDGVNDPPRKCARKGSGVISTWIITVP